MTSRFTIAALGVLLTTSVIVHAQQSDAPASDAKGVVRVQMLARVGASSVSTRNLYLYTCVNAPGSCGTYTDFVKRDSGRELQEYLLVKMAFEDNAIFKTVRFSDFELTKKFNDFEKANPAVWRRLQSEIQVQEVEMKSVLEEISIFKSLLAKQESLEIWIQQLRTRFKVQLFNQNAT